MKVDFNNARKQALLAHGTLVSRLNSCIIKDKEDPLYGHVVINVEEIEDVLDRLRTLIGSIAMSYIDGDPDVIDVFSEVFPEPDGCMPVFNPEEESVEG